MKIRRHRVAKDLITNAILALGLCVLILAGIAALFCLGAILFPVIVMTLLGGILVMIIKLIGKIKGRR